MRAAHSSFVSSAACSLSHTPKTAGYFSYRLPIASCNAWYSSFSLPNFAMTELKYSLKILLWTSTKVSNLNASDTAITSDILKIYTYYTAHFSAIQMCNSRLSLTADTFSFGLFVTLLWLGIQNGSVFLVQIQLDVEDAQPFRFFFQLLLKGKGL